MSWTPPSTRDVWIVDAVRTPIGRMGGALASARPDDLVAGLLRGLLARTASIEPALLDEVVIGCGVGAGEDSGSVGRLAALLAGLPASVPGSTVNRRAGSGLDAVFHASRAIAVGDAAVCIAGGVESVSRSPWVVADPVAEPGADRFGDRTLHATASGQWLVNERHDPSIVAAPAAGADALARSLDISRAVQDAYAMASHQKAAAAWRAGRFTDEVLAVAVGASLVADDECVDGRVSVDRLGRVAPSSGPDGTVTPANSAPPCDGASALLLASGDAVGRLGVAPLARIVARSVVACDAARAPLAAADAAERALAAAGIGWGDLAAIELDEVTAAQALVCLRSWPDVNRAIVNPNGGSIALGRAGGDAGSRMVTTLAHHLRRRGGGWALATTSADVAQALAIVLHTP